MSFEKSEIKIATAHEIGVRLDDVLEAVQREVQQAEGAHGAMVRAASAIDALQALVDRHVDEGRISDLEQAKLVKDWVSRAADVCRSLAAQAQTQHAQAQGKVAAMSVGVKIVKKFVDDESGKAAMRAEQEAAIALQGPGPREVGDHPGPSIKTKRTAKKAATKRSPRKKKE